MTLARPLQPIAAVVPQPSTFCPHDAIAGPSVLC